MVRPLWVAGALTLPTAAFLPWAALSADIRAEQQPAAPSARALTEQASELITHGQHDAAGALVERALEIAIQENDSSAEAAAIRGLGKIHQERAEFGRAIPYYV